MNDARVEFNAMLEGLANAELRGTVFPNLPADARGRGMACHALHRRGRLRGAELRLTLVGQVK